MKEEKSIAKMDDELLAELRALDTDTDKGSQFPSPPYIMINNSKVEKEITVDGKKKTMKVLCDPEFVERAGKDEDWAKTPYAPEFEGILLTTTMQIKQKWAEVQTEPYFSSYEFNTYNGTPIVLREGIGEDVVESPPYSWDDFSAMYKGKYVRWVYAYILVGEQVIKLALKPSSSRILNAYKNKIEKDGGHFSLVVTKFGLKTESGGEIEYHVIAPETVKGDIDTADILSKRKELLALLEKFSYQPKAEQEEEIKQVTDGKA